MVEGQNEEQMTISMNGDSQLVKMWLSFLLHNRWMQKNELGELKVTDKGNVMLEKYLSEVLESK